MWQDTFLLLFSSSALHTLAGKEFLGLSWLLIKILLCIQLLGEIGLDKFVPSG